VGNFDKQQWGISISLDKGSSESTYNEGDELEKGGGVSYTYNEVGERTKAEPSSGPATTYGYDQAGNLTFVERPEGESKPKIEDTYAYNGDGLRASQRISGTTSYVTWDTAEQLPLLLNDGTNSYIYGPGGLPVEQISSGGTVTYLHHDQQGSTRLLTNAAGENVGSTTYDAYGNVIGKTGSATSPLGYGAQYTDNDTGLIYLRAREYDPAMGQFLTVDPDVTETQEPYGYAADNPVNESDPTGLCAAAEAANEIGPSNLPGNLPGASKSDCHKWWSEAKRKYNRLRSKLTDLEREGPQSAKAVVEKHVQSWNEQVRNLRKILEKFDGNECKEDYGITVPAEAYELAEEELHVKVNIDPGVA
jgi:RHS repeat-associated protein